MLGLKYIAHGRAGGFGMAAFAYIRALHRAGVPLWTFFLGPSRNAGQSRHPDVLGLALAAEGDPNLADLPAILSATTDPIAYDTVLAHDSPERCRSYAEPGKRLIACTVWETEALPSHWAALLNTADAIVVPSRFNAQQFEASDVMRPVHVVPHIRRHALSESAREDGIALRLRMGIPEDHFVFYTIGSWDPRKAMDSLVDVFVRTFGTEDRVTLLVKTSAHAEAVSPSAMAGPSVHVRARRIIAAARRATDRSPPQIVLIAADDISGRTLEAIHATGDAYVSLSHGEGWALGAFDAATLGKPVIITGWGGQLDYLGHDYPGLVRYEMTPPVADWVPFPGYRATQRWASADRDHAGDLMRAAVARSGPLFEAARSLRDTIAQRYAEPVVVRQLIDAIEA